MLSRTKTRTYLVALLCFGSLGAGPSAMGQSEVASSIRPEIEKRVPGLLRRHNVPGIAIAVVEDGEVRWIGGFGLADIEANIPVTEDVVFNVGSISKSVSAWGFMHLVEEHIVGLDAPVEDYLNSWRFPESEFASEGVTLRRLLSHTAGTSLHGYPGFVDADSLPSLEESLAGKTNGAGDVRIVQQPGLKRLYSGGGYTVAQLMVEDQTGLKFAEFMKREVLLPLGMDSSNFGWTDSPRAANPYDESGKRIAPVRFTALAAAGLETTCHDLAIFAAASLTPHSDPSETVLKGSTIKLMQTQVSSEGSGRSSGLGYQQMRLGGTTVIGHLGSNSGWESAMFLHPETRDGLVMMSNGANGANVLRPIFAIWSQAVTSLRERDESRDAADSLEIR